MPKEKTEATKKATKPTDQEIRERAYKLSENDGQQKSPESYWLQAEQELTKENS